MRYPNEQDGLQPPEQAQQAPEEHILPQRLYERIHTRHIPLYQRLVHALCLTLFPFAISRLLSWILVKYHLFPEALDLPVVNYIMRSLEANLYPSSSIAEGTYASTLALPGSSSSIFVPSGTLMEKFVVVLVTRFGYEQDWWFTKAAGMSMFIVYTFIATLAISFSAVFHSLCFFFIMGKKWNDLRKYLMQMRNHKVANAGVF